MGKNSFRFGKDKSRRRSSGKGRGWNLRKGAKDYGKLDYREAGRKGGSRRVPKGFSMTRSRDTIDPDIE